MSDLVQRLRAPRRRPGYAEPLPPHPWMVEAADRIRELEAALREVCKDAPYITGKRLDAIYAVLKGSSVETACEHCKGTGKVGTEPGNVSYQMFTCQVCLGSGLKIGGVK